MEQSTNNMFGTAESKEINWRRKEAIKQCEGVCVSMVR